MKPISLGIVLVVAGAIGAVPLSMVMNSPGIINPNSIDDAPEDDDDDFTTHTLERLSSAATCLVAGVEYTHGQQIYRKDQCEFCLCLDGEMFCWWQDCPPAAEGPCKDRGPFSPCQNGMYQPPPPPPPQQQPKATVKRNPKVSTSASAPPARGQQEAASSSTDYAEEASTEVADYTSQAAGTLSSTTTTSSAPAAPKKCTVMGRDYNIGERLPHDTGNCVECICGQGAQISCSPHQCGPPGDDIADYRPPGLLRSAQPDVF